MEDDKNIVQTENGQLFNEACTIIEQAQADDLIIFQSLTGKLPNKTVHNIFHAVSGKSEKDGIISDIHAYTRRTTP